VAYRGPRDGGGQRAHHGAARSSSHLDAPRPRAAAPARGARAAPSPRGPCLAAPSHNTPHAPADEMVMNGCVVETNKTNVLKPILLLEKVAGK
jgi:hypothetical protein